MPDIPFLMYKFCIMKAKITILLLLCPIFLFSQEKISGQVLDKETRKPVSGVVVYTNSGNTMTMTDDKGYYTLDVHSSEAVYFRHLAYDFFETTSDALLNNSAIYLTLNAVELSEVVVTPDYAANMLNKAVQNLITRFQTKETKQYIVHSDETTSKGGKREAYALFNIALSGVNKKRGSFHWNVQLNLLDKISTVNEDHFYIKKKPLFLELLPRGIVVNRNKNEYIYEIQNINEDQIIIKVSPKHLNKKNWVYRLYTIDTRDTVVIESVLQSYSNVSELTTKKFRGVTWQITNGYGSFQFVQDEKTGLYYIADMLYLVSAKVLSESAYDISFKETISVAENAPAYPISTKKNIKLTNFVLFKTDFPNSPGFWEKYISP
ncbi:hypothetical protein SAMD00024442_16_65 [Candidatus Symbiothrix dinenymphae]|nr:hypothetical protein SAMD00024442_16_65 [Candidatus Symbiothrix dinenymphae]